MWIFWFESRRELFSSRAYSKTAELFAYPGGNSVSFCDHGRGPLDHRPGSLLSLRTPAVDEIPVGGRNREIISGFTFPSIVGAPGIFITEEDSIRPGNTNNGAMISDRSLSRNCGIPGSVLLLFVNRLQ